MSMGPSRSSHCANWMREPPSGAMWTASSTPGISVRLCSGTPMTLAQKSIERSRSVTLKQI